MITKFNFRLTEAGFAQDVEEMKAPNNIIIREATVDVIFDYPFKDCHMFTLTTPDGKYFTRLSLATAIADQYQEMYEIERQTSTLPEETDYDRARREGRKYRYLCNRAPTNGTYGIRMHMLGDLVVGGIDYFPGTNSCELLINGFRLSRE